MSGSRRVKFLAVPLAHDGAHCLFHDCCDWRRALNLTRCWAPGEPRVQVIFGQHAFALVLDIGGAVAVDCSANPGAVGRVKVQDGVNQKAMLVAQMDILFHRHVLMQVVFLAERYDYHAFDIRLQRGQL